MIIDDISLLGENGLVSPYLSSASSYSLISGTIVLTAKSVPSLSGLCVTPEGLLAVIFVEALPQSERAAGIMLLTRRKKNDTKAQKWLVQIQQGSFAWQLLADDTVNGKGLPLGKAIFLQWKPGSFGHAVERHHELVRAMPDDEFLIGSDLERVATSTLMLSEGYSSIANTYLNEPWFKQLIAKGGSLRLSDPCLEAASCVSVDWQIDADSIGGL